MAFMQSQQGPFLANVGRLKFILVFNCMESPLLKLNPGLDKNYPHAYHAISGDNPALATD